MDNKQAGGEAINMSDVSAYREKVIVRTSITGIIANVLLAAFKAVVGLLSNSIAVVLDAVNNLSDAISSIVTIIGAKIANKKPDKKHPLGHGRVEYISAMVVAAIILYAGITSLIESIKKIIEPETPDYSIVSLVIIAAAIVVKILLGRYVKAQGKKVNSSSLIASGADATFDAVLSLSVLVCALIFIFTGLSLEAYVGIIISGFIIKAGIEMMKDTISDILGRRADPELTKRIKQVINEEPEVMGAYDLALNNYGPEKNYASVHIELPDVMTVDEVDRISRRIQENVYTKTGVILTGISVYSHNTGDDEAAKIRDDVKKIVLAHEWAIQMHGFNIDIDKKQMRFDAVLSFDIDYKEAIDILCGEVKKEYPDYDIFITPDVDISD